MKLFFFIVLFISSSTLFSQILEQNYFVYDCNDYFSSTQPDIITLQENSDYDIEKNYGWVNTNLKSRNIPELYKKSLRDDITSDGFVSSEFNFRTNIKNGKWVITFFVDNKRNGINKTTLIINNNKVPITLHKTQPSAERDKGFRKIYRVLQHEIEIKNNELNFNLFNTQDSLCLLGFSLFRIEQQKTQEQLEFISALKDFSKYNSDISVSKFIDTHKYLNENNSFSRFWLQQLRLLKNAEMLFHMMGWEYANTETGLALFARMDQSVFLFDALIENNISELKVLDERIRWYRGRLTHNLFVERGGLEYKNVGRTDILKLLKKHPANILLQMYSGKKIKNSEYDFNDEINQNAPSWSKLQYESLSILRSELDYWVEERQASNGELGGKLGDDVEILRWWSSLLSVYDTTTVKGWKKLADCVWNHSKTYKGFSKRVLDVEHSSEYIADSAPEFALIYDDTNYVNRLKYTAEYFENLWSQKNKNGRRYFKSGWYSSTQVDTTSPKNRDIPYNARTMKALRYLAMISPDKHYTKLLKEWSDAWLHIALSEQKGKPKGIIPSSVRDYDEAINGDGENWFIAGMYWKYFNWGFGVGSQILDNLLYTYFITGEPKYLEPIELTLDLLFNAEEKNYNPTKLVPGSIDWTIFKIRKNKSFWNVVQQYRLITNNDSYDELILKYGSDYSKYRITNNEKYLEDGLASLLENIRYNTPLRTSELVHTDRVRTRGAFHLKAMLTGNGINEGSSPYGVITWEDRSESLTSLLKESSDNFINVQLFNHTEKEETTTLRIWQLEKGDYSISYFYNNEKIKEQSFSFNKRGKRILLELEGNKLIDIRISKR